MPARFHALLTNFIFGETSPRVSSRVAGETVFGMSASDVYRSGCRELSNMLALPQGGAYSREGFRFGRDVSQDADPAAATSFRLFMLRYETSDVLLMLAPGALFAYQIPNFSLIGAVAAPYSQTDLFYVGVSQYEKNVVIYSGAHRPRLFTLAPFSLTDPGTKFLPPLYSYQDTLSPIPQTGVWTVAFTFVAPTVQDVAYFQVSGVYARGSKGNLIATGIYLANDPATVAGIQAAFNNITTVVPGSVAVSHVSTAGQVTTYQISYKFYSSKGDGTGQLNVSTNTFPPITMTAAVMPTTVPVGDNEPLWSGPFLQPNGGHYFECIASHIGAAANQPGVGANWPSYWIDRGTFVPGDRDYDVGVDAWAIDVAYSPRGRGWPSAMTFYDQRLVGNGPPSAPAAVAGGRINNLFDFTLGVDDSDGVLYRIASKDNAVIRWFLASQSLLIGTTAGVWAQLALPWTPTNVQFQQLNGYNTSHIEAIELDGDPFFVTVEGQQIRQVEFSNDMQNWQSFELTTFAEHFFTETRRIKRIVPYAGSETYMWAVRTDGALMGMTYGPTKTQYHPLAWHKHNLSDPVIEVACGFDGTNFATIALVNRRTWIGGVWYNRPYLEILSHPSQNLFDVIPTFFSENGPPPDWEVDIYQGPQWSVHLDSYVQLLGNGGQTLTTDTRFAGRPVRVVENGVYLGEFEPNPGGIINVETQLNSRIFVGYGYRSRIEPNRFESQNAMTSQSQAIRWVNPVLRLVTSAMPLVNGVRPRERAQTDFYDVATGMFSGDVSAINFGSDGHLVIEQDLPLPFHLTGIFGLMTTEEG